MPPLYATPPPESTPPTRNTALVGRPDCDLRLAQMASDRATRELEVIGAVLSDPGRAVPVAEATGCHQHLFGEDDLRLIWLACDVARDYPVASVLRLARRALVDAGYWSDRAAVRLSFPWCDTSLNLLADSWPGCTAAVRRNVHRLVAAEARERHVAALLSDLAAALDDDAATVPFPATTTAPPRFAVAPNRPSLSPPARKRGAA